MTSLNIELLDWQKQVWADDTRFKIVAAGRRTGKSRLAAWMLIVNALQADKGQVFYVAPTQGQARDIMWQTLLDLAHPVVVSAHINNLQIKLVNGATISLKGADRPETMRGVSLKFLVMDEYADMKPEVFEQILRPALADQKGGELLDPDEIDLAKKSMSSYAFRQEFMASFEARGSEMFKEEWVKFGDKPDVGDYYISIDLAGFEDVSKKRSKNSKLDESAIAVVKVNEDGWFLENIIYGRWDLAETARKIFEAVRDYRPISVGIERGISKQAVMSPLMDMMKQNGRFFVVEELTHGNRKKTDRIMWALQGRFENGQITLGKGEWNTRFMDQLFQFPDVLTHDDLIDAFAYTDQLAKVAYSYDFEIDDLEILDVVTGY